MYTLMNASQVQSLTKILSTAQASFFKVLGISLVLAALVACSSDGLTRYSKQGVAFDMPEGWEVFEDININDQHRSINLITSRGSMVGVDVLSLKAGEDGVDINTYLKRYVSSALPTEELKASASIDFGTRTRAGHEGKFVHISTPEPTASEFLIETYQLTTATGSTFVVFNTPDSEVELLQQDFDRFLGSVSI
jgi:hypothetical protein